MDDLNASHRVCSMLMVAKSKHFLSQKEVPSTFWAVWKNMKDILPVRRFCFKCQVELKSDQKRKCYLIVSSVKKKQGRIHGRISVLFRFDANTTRKGATGWPTQVQSRADDKKGKTEEEKQPMKKEEEAVEYGETKID